MLNVLTVKTLEVSFDYSKYLILYVQASAVLLTRATETHYRRGLKEPCVRHLATQTLLHSGLKNLR